MPVREKTIVEWSFVCDHCGQNTTKENSFNYFNNSIFLTQCSIEDKDSAVYKQTYYLSFDVRRSIGPMNDYCLCNKCAKEAILELVKSW